MSDGMGMGLVLAVRGVRTARDDQSRKARPSGRPKPPASASARNGGVGLRVKFLKFLTFLFVAMLMACAYLAAALNMMVAAPGVALFLVLLTWVFAFGLGWFFSKAPR